MESHSSNRAVHQETVPKESIKLDSHSGVKELSPALQTLLSIARARYTSHEELAKKFDDSQEFFSSKMKNFLDASSLCSRAALHTVVTSKN